MAKARSTKSSDLKVLFEHRLGPGGARNTAAQVSDAQFIAFLDADDLWEENKLASQIAYHKANTKVVLTFTDYVHIAESDGREIIGCFEYWPHFSSCYDRNLSAGEYRQLPSPSATLFSENIVGTSTTVIRRDAFLAIGGFDVSLPSASDWDVWLKLAQVGNVAYCNDKTMRYLMREGSVSSNMEKRMQAMQTIINRHAPAAMHQDARSINHVRARLASGYRDICHRQNHRFKAIQYSLRAFINSPSKRYFKSLMKDALLMATPKIP